MIAWHRVCESGVHVARVWASTVVLSVSVLLGLVGHYLSATYVSLNLGEWLVLACAAPLALALGVAHAVQLPVGAGMFAPLTIGFWWGFRWAWHRWHDRHETMGLVVLTSLTWPSGWFWVTNARSMLVI